MIARTLALAASVAALGAMSPAAAAPKSSARPPGDDLATLSAARLSGLYRRSKDPYARLWIVDALYARVRDRQEAAGLDGLLLAAADRNTDVRRRAIGALEAVRYLPAGPEREAWLARLRRTRVAAARDREPAVRAAANSLARALGQTGAPTPAFGTAVLGAVSEGAPVPRPEESSPGRPLGAGRARVTFQVLIWIICFQLLGYAWQKAGMSLLRGSGRPASRVVEALGALVDEPWRLAFPAAATGGLFLVLGIGAGRTALDSMIPGSETAAAAASLGYWLRIWAAAGLCCYLPAALLASAEADPRKRVPWGAALTAAPRLAAVGVLLAAVVWPLELALAVAGRRPRPGVLWKLACAGAVASGCLAGVAIVRGGLGVLEAARLAARLLERAGEGESSVLRRPWGRPAFVLLAASSPVFCSLSLLPAVGLLRFSPTELFGLWFVTDAAFVVGFGVWAAILLSASAFAFLACAAAVEMAPLYAAVPARGNRATDQRRTDHRTAGAEGAAVEARP